MNGFVALLKREWLESRFAYLGAAAGVALLLCLGTGIALTVATATEGGVTAVIERMDEQGNREREERVFDNLSRYGEFTSWTDRELGERLSRFRHGSASVFHAVYFLVIAFVLLGCLYDERKDRSVLFWKSMPVTDTAAILSKLIVPVWLVPLLVVAAITLTWLVLLSMFSVVASTEELGSVGRLWANSGIGLGIVQELVGYAIQGLWALPVYGWLVLVSATVTRLPLLWAVLLPLSVAFLERISFGTDMVSGFFRRHLEFAALPRLTPEEGRSMPVATSVSDQFALLATGELWIGVLLGAAALAAAVYWHRRTNEI